MVTKRNPQEGTSLELREASAKLEALEREIKEASEVQDFERLAKLGREERELQSFTYSLSLASL